MKRFLTLIALLTIAGTVFGATTTLLDQDFEGLEYGDARNMRGFGTYVSANAEQFYCNVTNQCTIGEKSLWSGKVKKEGQSQRGGVWITIPEIENYVSEEGVLTLTCQFCCHSNMGGFALGTGDEDTDAYPAKLVFMSSGSKENPRVMEAAEALNGMGVKAVGYISEGTAHEWHTWRRSLYEFAQLIFK